MNHITTWLAACALAFALAASWDTPSDLDTVEAVAADVQDAIQTAQAGK